MAVIILQPASGADARRHYEDTIENSVPLSRIEPFLRPGLMASIRARFPGGVRVWGVTPPNEGKWTRVQRGDIALFARDGRYISYGAVFDTTHDRALAAALWGTDEAGQTWEYVYFVGAVTATDISPHFPDQRRECVVIW